jgi:hypothetical protein
VRTIAPIPNRLSRLNKPLSRSNLGGITGNPGAREHVGSDKGDFIGPSVVDGCPALQSPLTKVLHPKTADELPVRDGERAWRPLITTSEKKQ